MAVSTLPVATVNEIGLDNRRRAGASAFGPNMSVLALETIP
jgi:hypothetical protein